MKILAFTAEQAREFSAFILPGVLDRPESNGFWYLAATDEENGVMGMLVIDPNVQGAGLESIAVAPDFTRRGIATDLILFALERLTEGHVPFLTAGAAMEEDEWAPIEGLLLACGFVRDEALTANGYVIRLSEFAGLPLYQRFAGRKQSSAVAIASLTQMQRHELTEFLRRDGGLVVGGLADCDPDCSFIWRQNGHTLGIFLVTVAGDENLYNEWTWLDARAENPAILVSLVVAAIEAAKAKYGGDAELAFNGLSEPGRRLLEHMLGKWQTVNENRSYTITLPESLAPAGDDRPAAPQEEQELTPEEEEARRRRAEVTFAPTILTEADTTCRDCRFRMAGNLVECDKYYEKPGAVYSGGPCPDYEKED